MKYVNTQTFSIVTEEQIRQENPNVSFAHPFVAPEEYAYIFPAPAVYNPTTQWVREIAPVLTSKGHYEQQWEVVDKTEEELAEEAERTRIANVPHTVSPRQIRQALTRVNLRTAVETAVQAGDQDLKDWWEFATEFQRNNPHVIEMGIALEVSERQLDDLWTLAGTL